MKTIIVVKSVMYLLFIGYALVVSSCSTTEVCWGSTSNNGTKEYNHNKVPSDENDIAYVKK